MCTFSSSKLVIDGVRGRSSDDDVIIGSRPLRGFLLTSQQNLIDMAPTTVLVTGASKCVVTFDPIYNTGHRSLIPIRRGIGLECAKTLLSKFNAQVISVSRTKTPELEALEAKYGRSLTIVEGDMLVRHICKAYGCELRCGEQSKRRSGHQSCRDSC